MASKKKTAPQKVDNASVARPQIFLELGTNEADPFCRLTFELIPDTVPKTCENFKQLCLGAIVGDKKKDPKTVSYKGTRALRVTSDAIQLGDVTGRDDGKGQESIYGALFDDEQLGAVPHTFGVLSMVNSGPNTNGCQFFICLSEKASFLDNHHVSFGRLISNPEPLRALHQELINLTPSNSNGFLPAECPIRIVACGVEPTP